MMRSIGLLVLFFSLATSTYGDMGPCRQLTGARYQCLGEVISADDSTHPYMGLAGHLRELSGQPHNLERFQAMWREATSSSTQLNEEQRRHWLLSAASLARYAKPSGPTQRRPASVAHAFSGGVTPLPYVVPSLIAFRPGDIRERCPEVKEHARLLGARWVTFFYPLPYSGANRPQRFMSSHPIVGKDWRIERMGQPALEETEQCLVSLWKAGLEINWVPHLESVRQLGDPLQPEWRLLSGIPLDQHYFDEAFRPLRETLRRHPGLVKDRPLRVTLAAEIDPMVFASGDYLAKATPSLQRQLQTLGVRPELVWNSNGDFLNGLDLPQAKAPQCAGLHSWMGQLHRLAPSIYAEHGQMAEDKGRPHLALTKERFLKNLKARLQTLCPDGAWSERVTALKFSFGEFALKANQSAYPLVWPQLGPQGAVEDVTLWNEGIWDHSRQLKGSDRAPSSAATVLRTRRPP